VTAFNCASYLSLVVQSQRDGLDLLRRGGSSHRPQGNLGLSTSLYTPCIVRFCSLNPTISVCFLLVAACTMERGLSSESCSVSGPPTPSEFNGSPVAFQRLASNAGITCRDFPPVTQPQKSPRTVHSSVEARARRSWAWLVLPWGGWALALGANR
jgi:hypothetical protein